MIRIELLFLVVLDGLRTNNHLAHNLGHDGLSLVGCLLHFLVRNLDGDVEAAQVGDHRDAEGADAAVVGHDDLWDGGHAHGVATHGAVHAVFSRCLEGGTCGAQIDAVDQSDVLLLGNLGGQVDELVVVGFVHIREARSGGEVLAAQRVFGEEIDVVGDDHEVANLEGGIHATGSIGDEERLDAQFVHDADGERHLFHGVALVVVEAPLHGHDVYAAQLAEDECAGVSLDGGDGEVGYLGVGNLQFVSYLGS